MPAHESPLDTLLQSLRDCQLCRDLKLLHEHQGVHSYPLLDRQVPYRIRALVVAEAPNFDDTYDSDKGYLTYDGDTDPSGAFARKLLNHAGLDPGADVLFINAVQCLPARNQQGKFPVKARQTRECKPWLAEIVELADPPVVITFGGQALKALNWIERHGLTLDDVGQGHSWNGRTLYPMVHPGRLGRIRRPAELQMQDAQMLRRTLAGHRAEGWRDNP